MLFDTDVVINAGRGHHRAADIIHSCDAPAISAVTYMEYVAFCRDKRELAMFERMLQAERFAIHEIDTEVSMQAREYVRQYALSHSMVLADALIAATALKHAETLCTGNVKHFKHITALTLRKAD